MSKNTVEEGVFSLSLGDLMAALLLIFILMLSATLLKLKDQDPTGVYFNKRESLIDSLNQEFKDDLPKWGAEFHPEKISIVFTSPDVLFETGKATVKPHFKKILDDFIPRYLKVLSDEKFKEYIDEIRVEGHSSLGFGKLTQIEAYYMNMDLSQERTRNVLRYILTNNVKATLLEWTRANITANGLSSSKPILINGEYSAKYSKRVEFRVRLNANSILNEALEN
ncbi:OmpA family protein [Flammeovirga sp. EKP202]|uniref:OmpA/MotB family protein n=1 Tax=Flammeovirga sp. EKP202 TaxID=2770592 RepID=UPI00165F94E2|nr:OmpA family protein [Flammeovirga sp. EKP202]MBD0404009.1 OmpA family protein [Flammeovirga sp. EKP202]